jgi:hypothetical protein
VRHGFVGRTTGQIEDKIVEENALTIDLEARTSKSGGASLGWLEPNGALKGRGRREGGWIVGVGEPSASNPQEGADDKSSISCANTVHFIA